MAGLVGFRQLGLSFLLAHLADAPSGCYDKAVPVNEKLPLLIYSHGYGGNMDMGTYFLKQMASKGMIVAAVEHTDGTASSTVLPTGEVLPFSPSLYSGILQLQKRAEELVEAAQVIAAQYSTSSIYFGGHSYGAPSALVAAEKHKVDGLLLHDPALDMGYGMLNILDYKTTDRPPILSYISDEYNRGGVRCGDVTLHCQGAFHGNFVDAPLWAPLWVMRPLSLLIPAAGPANPESVHDQLADSAAAFMSSRDPFDERSQAGDLFEIIA
jgi:pimeloyl-ACP methyl ester carboxylesterase